MWWRLEALYYTITISKAMCPNWSGRDLWDLGIRTRDIYNWIQFFFGSNLETHARFLELGQRLKFVGISWVPRGRRIVVDSGYRGIKVTV